MKILTFGVGAFGFAMLKHIGENNPDKKIYAFEFNDIITQNIRETREHPFFFPGEKLPQNIKLLEEYDTLLGSVDMIILAVPSQCIVPLLDSIASYVPSGVIFLNLAKGIDISKNKTISSLLKGSLSGKSFEYAVFSGGVFASELVAGKKLGADLGVTNRKVGNEIKKLLGNGNLDICIQENYLNIELYGSFKNIIAIMVGYYEGKGEGLSTISYYIFTFLDELKEVVKLYGGDGDNIDFSSYSLGGDLITTCFGDSRNRYLGRLLGSGKSIRDALMILKLENKHSEGYETIKAVYKKIGSRGGFHITKFLYELMNG